MIRALTALLLWLCLTPLAQAAMLQTDGAAVTQAIAAVQNDPRAYAAAVALSADQDSGSWDSPEAGIARWQLQLTSAGARNLALRLRSLQLPAGASLSLIGSQDRQTLALGAAAHARVLPMVRGETLLLEARMPSAARAGFAIAIDRLYHGFRGLGPEQSVVAKGYFGDAGHCNIDVVCSLADNWRAEIRSVVLLTVPVSKGVLRCTGTLINNSAQDDRALVLTAHHCEIDSSNVADTVAYFNVQKSVCGGSGDGPVSQYLYGSQVLAQSSSGDLTDLTLFELASKPPGAFDAYYAGWDARGSAPACGASIHHPSGDDKKISFYASAAASDNVLVSNFRVDTWAVQWTRGTTEEGSSGAGLWSENHRLVGTLSGGSGACASSTSSSNNGGTDYYARLDRALSLNGNLRNALDAAGSGCSAINGKQPGSAGPAVCASDSGGSCGLNGDTSVRAISVGGGGGGGAWDWRSLLVLMLLGVWHAVLCCRGRPD
ncbi:hypothetical protein SAMN04488038_108148 [Solimonas aquatica]|uniref:Trypsin n=1 Tax=Solimonas aquatica TaxID=489703 RepID=A0A1H9HEY1_9GAMM|nr:hypothetical protein [Solimonas aquatica]SEQ60909.1 hypothetical protein SAMN04488038_108148 [Solimonas aquatica]